MREFLNNAQPMGDFPDLIIQISGIASATFSTAKYLGGAVRQNN